MTGFWSGALSALIGAIVGGLFTAVAATMQVRGTSQAANRQLREVFDHERQMRDEQYYRAAVADTVTAMSNFVDAMDALAYDHNKCKLTGAKCNRHTLSKQMQDAAAAVNRCGNIYWDLWEDSKDIEMAFELASALLYEDHHQSGLLLPDLVKESYNIATPSIRESYCGYGLLGYGSGASIAMSAMSELRKKAWSGIRLPPQHHSRNKLGPNSDPPGPPGLLS